MTHLDTEIKTLKSSVISMWLLVINQLEKAEKIILNHESDLAREVKINEKRVDAFELKLIMDCENILALFNPVAIDLRFILAVLKINYNLERVGDYAHSMAEYNDDKNYHLDKKLLKDTKVQEMFQISRTMLNEALLAFENEDSGLVRSVYQLDDDLDKITSKADDIITSWIQDSGNSKSVKEALAIHSIVRKLERVGDQTKNISTEIIFHTEAKMLHHTKKKKILKELDKDLDSGKNKSSN